MIRARRLKTLFLSLTLCMPAFVLAAEPAQATASPVDDTCMVAVDGKQEPAVAFTAGHYGAGHFKQDRVLALLDKVIARGCPIDKPNSTGATALNLAILMEEPDLVRYLLKAGSNAKQLLAVDKPWAKGMNSLGLAQLTDKRKGTENSRQIVELLEQATH